MRSPFPIVAIKCLTYNHGAYIRQCLDGFVMQKTDFTFIAIVHDDASTDNTADIIREYAEKYPDIIKPIYETENQYSKHDGSLGRIMNAAIPENVKYVAMCEGDDYWIDPFKLQKQVDYMEVHSNCSMTHTAFRYYFQVGRILKSSFKEANIIHSIDAGDSEKIIRSILNGNYYRIQTMTVVYRYDSYLNVIKSDPFLFDGHFLMGDTQLWTELIKRGKVHYFNDETSVYRVLENSSSHSIKCEKILKFSLSCEELRIYLSKKYNYSDLLKKFRYQYSKLVTLANIADLNVTLLFNKEIYRSFRLLNLLIKFYPVKNLLKMTVLSYWIKKNNLIS